MPFLWLISTFPVLAGEMIKRSILVPDSEKLYIEITRGFVKVEGWEGSEISLQGELDDTIKEIIFKNKGSKTLIKAVITEADHWGDESVIKVFVPTTTRVYFRGVNTSFNLNNLPSGANGSTISGDVKIKNVHSMVKVNSMSGNIFVEKSSGDAELESVSGEISLSGSFTNTLAKSMSGNIAINISDNEKLSIKNISGDTRISGSIKNGAFVELSSVNGDIEYDVEGQLNAQCELETKFGGKITNGVTADLPKESMLNKKTLSFESGDGSGQLLMSTVTGSITINRKDQ